ncbi:MAG: peptidyl-prolyl cis-trans isomerase, partial [Myxococcota bacterium]|nr:peptidyl-prolyl cis-trans isomerase [Myxococcota bacterium]
AAIAAGGQAGKAVAGLSPEQAAAIVARVGDQAITLGDVAAYVAQLPRSARSRYVTPQQQRELVRHMVEVELLAHEGEQRGFGTDPIVQHTYKKALANELLRTVTTDLSLGDITDADVKAYYDTHSADFVRVERRRCAVIYFNQQADAQAAAKGIEEAVAATPKAAKQIFGDWAREKSIDEASGALKGDLGWFDQKGLNTRGQTRVAGRILSETFAMDKVHTISAPLKLESRQWVLVQLTGIQPQAEAPMDAVRLEIQNALLTAKRVAAREEFIAQLRTDATIEVDEAVLAKLPAPEPAPKVTPPEVPKPKFNPALFRRSLNPGVVRRPGAGGAQDALKVESAKGKVRKKNIDTYLKHRQEEDPSATTDPGAP